MASFQDTTGVRSSYALANGHLDFRLAYAQLGNSPRTSVLDNKPGLMACDPWKEAMTAPAPTTEFKDDFTEPSLSAEKWIPHYLPQWTTPERSRAAYSLETGVLVLEIRAEQPSWLPSDGLLRVSNIQTATFSGEEGSGSGTHRHRRGLRVATPQLPLRLYTPIAPTRVEVSLRAHPHPDCMLAFWLVGSEDRSPEDSGEICVVEIFGNKAGSDLLSDGATHVQSPAELNLGVKKHHDPALEDDMTTLKLEGFNACEWHRYAAEWDEREVRIFIDDELVKCSSQVIKYLMQLMISLCEFPESEEERTKQKYPKKGEVGAVLGGTLLRPTLKG